MVWKDLSGKYLRFDDVRIKYDPKTDSVVLTTKDTEVLNKTQQGFRIVVPRNSPEDKALREVLKRYDLYRTSTPDLPFGQAGLGVIPGDDWATALTNSGLPRDLMPSPEESGTEDVTAQFSDTNLITIGTDENNNSIHWDYKKSPHLMIIGLPGTGKTVAINNILPQLTRGQAAEVFVADPKRLPLTNEEEKDVYRRLGKKVRIATTRESIKKHVNTVENIRETRWNIFVESPRTTFDPVFLVLDETAVIFNHDNDQYNLRELHRTIQNLVRFGRAVNIQVIMTTQVPHYIPASIRDNITALITLRSSGETAQYASTCLFGSAKYGDLFGTIERQHGVFSDQHNKPVLIKMASPAQ